MANTTELNCPPWIHNVFQRHCTNHLGCGFAWAVPVRNASLDVKDVVVPCNVAHPPHSLRHCWLALLAPSQQCWDALATFFNIVAPFIFSDSVTHSWVAGSSSVDPSVPAKLLDRGCTEQCQRTRKIVVLGRIPCTFPIQFDSIDLTNMQLFSNGFHDLECCQTLLELWGNGQGTIW